MTNIIINAPNLVSMYKVNESNKGINGIYSKYGSGEISVVINIIFD